MHNLPALTQLFADPRTDLVAVKAWIEKLSQMPPERKTTGDLVDIITKPTKPCMCSMGVAVVMGRKLDPTTARTLDIRNAGAHQLDSSDFYRFVIPTADFGTDDEPGPDHEPMTRAFWEIVGMNDAPHYWPFAQIAAVLKTCLPSTS